MDKLKTNKDCDLCGGTGEMLVSTSVYKGEPHEAFVDTAPCTNCHEGEEDYSYAN